MQHFVNTGRSDEVKRQPARFFYHRAGYHEEPGCFVREAKGRRSRLPDDVRQFFQHLVGNRDGSRVGGEASLRHDEIRKFQSHIDVG